MHISSCFALTLLCCLRYLVVNIHIYDKNGHFMSEVFAVKKQSQLDQIEHLLQERGTIYVDVWIFGLNSALRIADILNIKMADIDGLDPACPKIHIREGKTKKYRWVKLNRLALEVVTRRRAENPQHDYLFQSRMPRRGNDADSITSRSVLRVFSEVGQKVTPRVKLGTHSMRKTRGYMMHADGVPLAVICDMLNHDHPRVTMRYVGLTQETVEQSYDDYVIGGN